MRSIVAMGIALAGAAPALAGSLPGTLVIAGGKIAVPAPSPSGVISFKGLPYAAPPVGPLRWRPPLPPRTWPGVRRADQFGPDCMQQPSASASPVSRPRSEDCLTLNIWTGNVWTGAPRHGRQPVFVWIHGGGSRVGSGAQPQFDGTALARKGVVVVTINYRLGPFGFLSTSALSAESGYGASGNYGFMDQIAALRWVKRNIAAFGGDPARVTIGGESSGSVSTGTLMASPLASDLFQQVIGESGSVFRVAEYGSMGATGLTVEENKGDRLADALGTRDLAQLRRLPAAAVLAAAGRMGIFYNLPVVDGKVLPASPARLFAERRHNDVPLLAGWNAQEGSLPGMGGLAPVPDLLAKYYGPAAARIATFYPARNADDVPVQIKITGDNQIGFSTWKWAMAQHRYGSRPVYLYEFDRAPPLPPGAFGSNFDVSRAGAFHGAEIVYVFDTLAAQPLWAVTADDRRIARQMSSYWANFIKTGNPNGADLPPWPAYEPAAGPQRLEIGLDTRAQADPDYAKFMAIEDVHRQIDPPDPVAPTARGAPAR